MSTEFKLADPLHIIFLHNCFSIVMTLFPQNSRQRPVLINCDQLFSFIALGSTRDECLVVGYNFFWNLFFCNMVASSLKKKHRKGSDRSLDGKGGLQEVLKVFYGCND